MQGQEAWDNHLKLQLPQDVGSEELIDWLDEFKEVNDYYGNLIHFKLKGSEIYKINFTPLEDITDKLKDVEVRSSDRRAWRKCKVFVESLRQVIYRLFEQ